MHDPWLAILGAQERLSTRKRYNTFTVRPITSVPAPNTLLGQEEANAADAVEIWRDVGRYGEVRGESVR